MNTVVLRLYSSNNRSCHVLRTHCIPSFSSVQLLSRVQLFATPWTAACQASLSIPNSRSLFKLMSIESVMPSNYLILSSPSLPAFNLSQHQYFSQGVSSSHPVAKVLKFQLQHPSNEYSGLISFKMYWFDLLAVPGTLKTFLQHYSSKTSILRCSGFFIVQLSHPCTTNGNTILISLNPYNN